MAPNNGTRQPCHSVPSHIHGNIGGAGVEPSAMEKVSAEDARFMREAIAEGSKALPGCLPNPPVGCVLVRNGEIIARGHTQAPFESHAEPAALALVDGTLGDVTCYVTLEPCSFHQRTPSCAKTMIARGVGRAVVALIDPHPRNRGRGLDMLREAGMQVVSGVLKDEAGPGLLPYLHGSQDSA